MRGDLKIVPREHRATFQVCARGVRFGHVPPENVACEEIRIGNSGDASVELEMPRGDVSPVRVVLVVLIELAAELNGVLASNQGEDIADVVHALAESSIDVAVPLRARQASAGFAGAESHCAGPCS